MADKTTTVSDEAQADENNNPQPESIENEAADNNTNNSSPESDGSVAEESNTETEDESSGGASTPDDDLEQWAKEKNLPLDDPLKLAKMYRESEKKMHETGTQAAELRKQVEKQAEESAVEGESQEDTTVRQLLNKLAVTDFYLNNPEARQYDGKMAEILTEKPYLANDLDSLYLIARAKTSDEQLLSAKKEGQKSALESAAKSARQGSPSISATTKSVQPKDDPILAALQSDD